MQDFALASPELDSVRAGYLVRIDPDEERDLERYFAGGGVEMFSASTFGKQLERASLAAGGRACPKCKGTGFVASTRIWRQMTPAERELERWLGRGRRKKLPPLRDKPCPRCDATGWVPKRYRRKAVTARPTGSSVPLRSGGIDVGDSQMAMLGSLAARLARIEAVWTLAVDVLAAYYDREEIQHADGNRVRIRAELVGVSLLTPAGKTLLRRRGVRSFDSKLADLPPFLAMENISAANVERPDPNVTALLRKADEQAREYYQRAAVLWNRAAVRS